MSVNSQTQSSASETTNRFRILSLVSSLNALKKSVYVFILFLINCIVALQRNKCSNNCSSINFFWESIFESLMEWINFSSFGFLGLAFVSEKTKCAKMCGWLFRNGG